MSFQFLFLLHFFFFHDKRVDEPNAYDGRCETCSQNRKEAESSSWRLSGTKGNILLHVFFVFCFFSNEVVIAI